MRKAEYDRAKKRRAKRRQARSEKVCDACWSFFIPKRADAVYCSAKCKQQAHRLRMKGHA
jgi:hypothetical protein